MLNISDGLTILVDKPYQWTSFDVVNKIRWNLKKKLGLKNVKVGHAGTLDPLATGLLIVCTGKFTKRINQYMAQQKEYTGTITIGATTPTYDLESEPTDFIATDHITLAQVRSILPQFTGPIQQVPPAHSAIKVDGKRVYELARKGKEVKLEPRSVHIYSFELLSLQDAQL
ncbi:MAG: tRNA pseudouridine(55) synthase TruB, partial [Bacteroidota bacterium]